MERILNIITLDVRKKKFIISKIIIIFIISCIISLNYILLNKSNMCELSEVPSMLLSMIPFIILVTSSVSLTQEFSNKTDKMIFTGIFSRNEIMISKLMSFIFTSTLFFIFYEIVCGICKVFDSKLLLNNFSAFMIYTFTIGSFILLVSTITPNFIIVGIIGYILYFDLILVLLKKALESSINEVLKKLIENSPFYIANTGFNQGNYTINQSMIMISCGVVFLGISCVIINRKNL